MMGQVGGGRPGGGLAGPRESHSPLPETAGSGPALASKPGSGRARSEALAEMRRQLGRQLAARRKAAALMQRELGTLAGYSRTAIANAETGAAGIGRHLWERVDQVLGTGELFARGYDRIQEQIAAESQAAGQLTAGTTPCLPGHDGEAWHSLTPSQAMRFYRERGWPAKEGPGPRLSLQTGAVIDALEVPRQAGMVAMGWWLYTRGVPDQIRGLPALPDPASALAVIAAGPRFYFLTQSGMCPWTRRDLGTAGTPGSVRPVVIRWYADGGRIPAPPSPLGNGENATWAHVPSSGGPLVSPLALLHVLAQATAASSEGAELLLPGGVRAVPAASTPLT